MKKIYLIAGEASGDNIGSKLIKAIKLLAPDTLFYGVGGKKMREQGMNLLFPSEELAVMGFLEIIPYLPKFILRLKQTISDILSIQPDVVITIDSPGFSFRVAKAIKNRFKGKLIHYVAPTVWAYKPERAKEIAKLYNHLLVILPFEPQYFLKEGLNTTFVGYPAIEDLHIDAKAVFREKYHLKADDLVVCLAPGSRKQEINSLLPIFLDSIVQLQKNIKRKVIVAIPTQEHLKLSIQKYIPDSLNVILVEDEDKLHLFSSADLALSKSGTITTELAFYQLPMVVAHKINYLSYWLLKRLIKIQYVTIINLLAKRELIPELLQKDCNPQAISQALEKIIKKQNIMQWKKDLKEQLNKLQVNNISPSEVAAKKILEIIAL
ncbi:MAG: lipid-A-disaccharide synthase [Rickettsiales bacterium]